MNTAVIFAGGKSSRMGKDKALLPLGDYASMAELQYTKLQKLFPNVYLSSKEDKFDFDAPILYDRYSESSPMVGLASVLEQIEEEDEAIFVLSVDMPLIGRREIEKIITCYQESNPKADILIAKSPRGLEPLCGIYRSTILSSITSLLAVNKHRMQDLFEDVNTQTVTFEDESAFANINTPAEYQAILP